MNKIIYLLLGGLISIYSVSHAQQQLAFSFAETPQTLLLNPGAETNFRYHYGIPLLSNFNVNANIKGFDLSELFLNDGQNFDLKFRRVLDQLKEDDHISIDMRSDILNGGYRYDDKTYLSFGFYQELSSVIYMPKDFIELFYYGNSNFLNRSFSFSQLTGKLEILGVLHAGISKKMNSKLNLGARVKVYSSSFHLESNYNSGTFTTFENETNLFRQSLNNVHVQVRTSGLVDSSTDQVMDTPKDLFTNTFLGGNLGLGLDVGMTYHFTPQLEFTASILDLGFIRHSKNARTYSVQGNYTLDGINFEYDSENPRDYWQELEEDFKEKVPSDDSAEAYTSWRPTRINTALKYSFGEPRPKVCYSDTRKKYYHNAVGFQVHSVFRPKGTLFAFTSFFEKSFSGKIHVKLTHTMNEYSATIIGSGFSVQWGKVNMFGLFDNLLGARDLLSASNITVNFGVNMVIK